MRGRFPLKKRVRMTLSERRRAMNYWLFLLYGLEPDPADAVLVERVAGLSRGRSRRLSAEVDWPPEEWLPRRPITPRVLKQAVSEADIDTFRFVGAALESMLKLIRYLAPVLLPTNLRSFSEDAISLFDEAPAPAVGLLAAVQIANVHRTRGANELPAEYIDAVQVGNAFRELTAELNPDEVRELIASKFLRRHTRTGFDHGRFDRD
jgi:hypothetical protein